jgi:hypothetical protein
MGAGAVTVILLRCLRVSTYRIESGEVKQGMLVDEVVTNRTWCCSSAPLRKRSIRTGVIVAVCSVIPYSKRRDHRVCTVCMAGVVPPCRRRTVNHASTGTWVCTIKLAHNGCADIERSEQQHSACPCRVKLLPLAQ